MITTPSLTFRALDLQLPQEPTERDQDELEWVASMAAAQRVLDRICPELRRLCSEIEPPVLGG
jgi:hypothetical protein